MYMCIYLYIGEEMSERVLTINRPPPPSLLSHPPTQNIRTLRLPSSDIAVDKLLLDGCDARLAGAVKAMGMGPPVLVAAGLGVRGCIGWWAWLGRHVWWAGTSIYPHHYATTTGISRPEIPGIACRRRSGAAGSVAARARCDFVYVYMCVMMTL